MNLTVDINKKHIDTEPMQGLLVQGETLADSIIIQLPLTYGAVDLTELNYAIRATNEETEVTASLVLTKTVTDDSVDLAWPVSATFTAQPGKYTPVLEGADGEGDIIIKLVGDPYSVRRDPTLQGFSGVTPSLLSQFIAQAYALIAGINVVKILGTYATLEALTAGVTSPQIGDIYAVGAGEPYTGYVWVGSWTSLGALRGPQGLPGVDGTDGVDGVGVPSGGTTLQALVKIDGANYNTNWASITAAFVGAVAIAAASYTDAQKIQIRTNIDGAKAVSGVADAIEAATPINAQTDNYTAALSDLGKDIWVTNAAAKTLTIPLQSAVTWPDKAYFFVSRGGAGTLTIAGASGVTINAAGNRLKVAEQYGTVMVRRTAENVWQIIGSTAT